MGVLDVDCGLGASAGARLTCKAGPGAVNDWITVRAVFAADAAWESIGSDCLIAAGVDRNGGELLRARLVGGKPELEADASDVTETTAVGKVDVPVRRLEGIDLCVRFLAAMVSRASVEACECLRMGRSWDFRTG